MEDNRVDLLFLTCPLRVAKPLVDELEDKLAELHCPARTVVYGTMSKARQDFVLLACLSPQGFPDGFFASLQRDEEITGYVLVKGEEQRQQPDQQETEEKLNSRKKELP